MPKCVVYGCSNLSEDGFIMKRFPQEENRRKLWLQQIKREDWNPRSDAMICEVHFTPDSWEESREDFIRMLKRDAVPALFAYLGHDVPTIPYSHARKCCAIYCFNRDGYSSKPTVSFHRFPLDGDKELLDKWILATGDSSFSPSDDSYICSYHFKPHEIDKVKDVPTLKQGAYPTILKTIKTTTNSSGGTQKDKLGPSIDLCKSFMNPYLEIHGLDPCKQGDLNGDILRISMFFGVKLEPDEILRCFIFKKKNSKTGEKTMDTVIVKFANLTKKMKLVEAFKNSDRALVDSSCGEPVYLTDELSASTKKLLSITEKIPVDDVTSIRIPGEGKNFLSSPQQNIVYKKVVRKIIPKPVNDKVVSLNAVEISSSSNSGQDGSVSSSGIVESNLKGKSDDNSSVDIISNSETILAADTEDQTKKLSDENTIGIEQSKAIAPTEDLVCLALQSIELSKEECDVGSLLTNTAVDNLKPTINSQEPELSSLLRDLESSEDETEKEEGKKVEVEKTVVTHATKTRRAIKRKGVSQTLSCQPSTSKIMQ